MADDPSDYSAASDPDPSIFEAAVQEAYDAIIITDGRLDRPGPRIVYVNQAFEAISGYSAAEILGRTPRILQGPDSCRTTLDRLRGELQAGRRFQGQLLNYRRDGTRYHVELRVAPIAGPDGTTTHYVSQQRDITDEVVNQAGRDRLLAALDAIPDEVKITDPEGRITYVNRACRERTGADTNALVGTYATAFSPDSRGTAGLAPVHRAIDAGEPVVHSIRVPDAGGRDIDIDQHISPVRDANGNVTQWVITGRDVSDRVAAEQALQRLATTDRLTGLNNRLRFEQQLDAELERFRRGGSPFSLVLLDLDDFKAINDDHGHETGDDVLQALAELLQANTRAGDTVGRWGGEEFTVLLPDTPLAAAQDGAAKLCRLVAGHGFALPQGITISCGISEVADNDSIKALLRRADRALYRAKENGKNRVEAEPVSQNRTQS